MISLPLLLAALVCSIPDRVQHAPERASKGEDERVFSRIVYINLDTSPDRAESLASQCEQFSVPCSRFPALGVDATRAALLELGWAPLRAADDAGARPAPGAPSKPGRRPAVLPRRRVPNRRLLPFALPPPAAASRRG